MTIDLAVEQSEFVDRLVARGEFASPSEVVAEALASLRERDEEVEDWLREQVAPTYDALRDGREPKLTLEDARRELEAHQTALTKMTK
ncbi:MAG: type II toxin-antitoxin system ParD family antitoxin [Alphaproteobacteria bacterium]